MISFGTFSLKIYSLYIHLSFDLVHLLNGRISVKCMLYLR